MTPPEPFDPRFVRDVRARLRGERQGPPFFCPWCGEVFALADGAWLAVPRSTDCGSSACAHTGALRRHAFRQRGYAVPQMRTVAGWLQELENPDLAHLVAEAVLGHPYYRLVSDLLAEPHEA